MPDVNFQSPSTTDHFEFALWCLKLESTLKRLSLDKFLFVESFSAQPRNDLEKADSDFICHELLSRKFPQDYNRLLYLNNCTEMFDAIKLKYFPLDPHDYVIRLYTGLVVDYNTDFTLLPLKFQVVNFYYRPGNNNTDLLDEDDFMQTFMDSARFNFAQSFSDIYQEWVYSGDKYSIQQVVNKLIQHKLKTPEKVQREMLSRKRQPTSPPRSPSNSGEPQNGRQNNNSRPYRQNRRGRGNCRARKAYRRYS